MRKRIVFFAAVVAVFFFGLVSASAQNFRGDITPLKGQKEVNLVIDFTGTLVNDGTEEAYIAEEIKEKTEEEKTQWLKEWNEYLRENTHKYFVTYFNKKMEKEGMLGGKYPNAEYTICVQVKEIYVGEPVMFVVNKNQYAKIIADVNFIKTGTTIPFATITEQYSYGMDFWFVERIARTFVDLGREIAKSIINFSPTTQTQDIISICNIEVMNNEFIGSWNRALRICPDGWRLPTTEEMKCMCKQKKTKKNDSPLELHWDQYWTSKEAKNPNKAVSIDGCDEEIEDKTNFFGIRYVKK